MWTLASPLTLAGKHASPALFINSSVDPLHASREDYIKILNGYNIYAEMQRFKNSSHHFCWMDPWFEPNLNYTDAFLKKNFCEK